MAPSRTRKTLPSWLIAIAVIITAIIIVTSTFKLWQHFHHPDPIQSTTWSYQTADVCPVSFPLPPRNNQANYWKLYPKDTSQNPTAVATLFPSEVGNLYGPHDQNNTNLAAVDVQCASSSKTLSQLINAYRQALQQTASKQATVIDHQQTITKWQYPTAMLSLPNGDPQSPDNTVYLVATGHHIYLIQAVTLNTTPTAITSDTAKILDQLKLEP